MFRVSAQEAYDGGMDVTLVIAEKSDLRSVTELLTDHPEWHYSTEGGERGTIIVHVHA